MSTFVKAPDLIDRAPVAVMLAACADEVAEIQQLWPRFEGLVGLRGRKMYAAADLNANTYTTCTPVLPDDDPRALGIEVGELSGGLFRRGRLRGEPPELYDLIGSGFKELQAAGSVDGSRPLIEFYKRRDEIELWLPVLP